MRAKLLLASGVLLALPFTAGAVDHRDADVALAEAGASVEAASRADAGQYAPQDLNRARDMLATAQAAYDHRAWTDSFFASDSAKADANLAAARSRQHRAEAITTELDTTVRSLREQLGVAGGQP
jgi:hypothetical protein